MNGIDSVTMVTDSHIYNWGQFLPKIKKKFVYLAKCLSLWFVYKILEFPSTSYMLVDYHDVGDTKIGFGILMTFSFFVQEDANKCN